MMTLIIGVDSGGVGCEVSVVSLCIGTYHMPLEKFRVPSISVLLFFVIINLCLSNVAMQLSSHSCPIESKLADVSLGKIWAFCAWFESDGIGIFVDPDECKTSPLGNLT